MNYYRRYVGDYLRDTMSLTATDHGVYGLMLDYCYAEEKPIPLDMEEVYSISKAIRPDDRKSVAKVLAKYFTRREDGYHNSRADREIATSRQARDNGKGGGRPRTGTVTGTVTGEETGQPPGDLTGTITGSQTEMGGGSGHPPAASRQPPTALSASRSSRQRASRDPPPAKPAAAASLGNGFFYPEKLTHADREEAVKLLNGNPHAQYMLDELAGAMASKSGVDSPIGMLVRFIKLEAAGTMRYSHAAKIATERELFQVQAELAAAGKSDMLPAR